MQPAPVFAAASYAMPGELDESLVSRLRRRALALAVAQRLGDRGAASIVAERLRRSVREAQAQIASGALPVARAATLASHVRAARRLLQGAPERVSARALHHWTAAPPSLGRAGAAADLFDLDGRGAELERARLGELHLLQCQLAGAKLYGASLESALLDSCDLTSIDGRASRWRDAVVLRGRLQGAALAGADLEGVLFSDCDLRGADLGGEPGGGGKAARSLWIRCDLRNTVWTHRVLIDAHFVSCRLEDARELRLGEGGSAVRCEPALGYEAPPASAVRDVLGAEPTRRDLARAQALARGMREAAAPEAAREAAGRQACAPAARRGPRAVTRELGA